MTSKIEEYRQSPRRHTDVLSQSFRKASLSTTLDTPESSRDAPSKLKALQRVFPLQRVLTFKEDELDDLVVTAEKFVPLSKSPDSPNQAKTFQTQLQNASPPAKENTKQTFVSSKKSPVRKRPKTEEKDLSTVKASHLEVIRCLKRFRNLQLPFPFADPLPQAAIPYSSMDESLKKRIRDRKRQVEYLLPQKPKEMSNLLKNLKETERVLRQEPYFLKKLRDLKPEIELEKTDKGKRKDFLSRSFHVRRKNKDEGFSLDDIRHLSVPKSGLIINDTLFSNWL
ncbi:unnamed protein product [Blepharisma stoltei]|uniref:Uncharacterized protein n=1 Tax=Blepharisma stoltei TaxID=1481888 RepID=A0AAU9IRF0_9CILI|nr:unnamed protein product [Blepharisma stoltei]